LGCGKTTAKKTVMQKKREKKKKQTKKKKKNTQQKKPKKKKKKKKKTHVSSPWGLSDYLVGRAPANYLDRILGEKGGYHIGA